MRAILGSAAIALAFGTAAFAAKPPGGGSGGTTDPKIGYVAILSSGARELRLANEDGTGSVKLASTPNHGQMTLSLGPRSSGKLSYNDGGKLHLLTYEVGPGGTRTTSDLVIVDTPSRGFGYHRFSPSGTKIAYVYPGTNDIYLYDVASGQTSQLLSVTGYIMDLDFSHDGSRIIYSVTADINVPTVQLKAVPVAGGTPVDLPISGQYGDFRVAHLSDSIVADVAGDANGVIKLISADGNTIQSLASGYYPDLRCDDTKVIFQRINQGRNASVSLLKYEVSTGLQTTFSTSGNYWPDYFPDC